MTTDKELAYLFRQEQELVYQLRQDLRKVRKDLRETQKKMYDIAKNNCEKAPLAKKALMRYSKDRRYW